MLVVILFIGVRREEVTAEREVEAEKGSEVTRETEVRHQREEEVGEVLHRIGIGEEGWFWFYCW